MDTPSSPSLSPLRPRSASSVETLSSCQARLAAAETECESLRKSAKQLRQALQSGNAEKSRLSSALADRDEAVFHLEEQLRQREMQHREHLVQVENAFAEHQGVGDVTSGSELEVQAQLDGLRQANADKTEKIQRLRNASQQKTARIAALEKHNESLQKQVQMLLQELNSSGIGQLPSGPASATTSATAATTGGVMGSGGGGGGGGGGGNIGVVSPRKASSASGSWTSKGTGEHTSVSSSTASARHEVGAGVGVSLVHKYHEHLQAVGRVCFANAVNHLVACGSRDGTISVVSLEDGQLQRVHALKGHTGAIHDLEWSVSSERLLSGSADGTARVWDVATGNCIRSINLCSGDVLCSRFHPRNNNVFVVGTLSGELSVCNLSTGKIIASLVFRAPISALCFDSFGAALFVGFESGVLQWFSFDDATGTLKRMCLIALPSPCVAALSYQRRNLGGEVDALLLASYRDSRAVLFRVDHNMGTLSEAKVLVTRHESAAVRSAFGPGNIIVSGGEDKFVSVFDLRNSSEEPIARLHGHAITVLDVSWSSNGDWMASSDEGGLVLFWRKLVHEK